MTFLNQLSAERTILPFKTDRSIEIISLLSIEAISCLSVIATFAKKFSTERLTSAPKKILKTTPTY